MVRHAFAWFFLIYFALIGAAGEGLHLLPGCGHYIELGGQLRGLGIPKSPVGDRPTGEPSFDCYQPPAASVLYAGDCPICSLLAQCRAAAQLCLVLPHRQVVVFLAESTCPLVVQAFGHAFDARGPPNS